MDIVRVVEGKKKVTLKNGLQKMKEDVQQKKRKNMVVVAEVEAVEECYLVIVVLVIVRKVEGRKKY